MKLIANVKSIYINVEVWDWEWKSRKKKPLETGTDLDEWLRSFVCQMIPFNAGLLAQEWLSSMSAYLHTYA